MNGIRYLSAIAEAASFTSDVGGEACTAAVSFKSSAIVVALLTVPLVPYTWAWGIIDASYRLLKAELDFADIFDV